MEPGGGAGKVLKSNGTNPARVSAAVLREDHILMVNAVHKGRTGKRREGEKYWTLPGGGVQSGESLEAAALRELLEETGLGGRVIKLLFTVPYSHGRHHCFLVEVDPDAQATLGTDPEIGPDEEAVLIGLQWFQLEAKKADWQVAKVIDALSLDIGS